MQVSTFAYNLGVKGNDSKGGGELAVSDHAEYGP